MSGKFQRMLFLTATPFQLVHKELIHVLRSFRAIRWNTTRSPSYSSEDFESRIKRLEDALDENRRAGRHPDRLWGKIQPEMLGDQDVESWWRRVEHAPADESEKEIVEAVRTRERLALAFNSPLFPEILVSSSVMGEGIDLHRFCRHVIHHDGYWNPSTLEQQTGRIDRIRCEAEACGLPIRVYQPFVAGSADEKMFRVVRDRERWFQVVMGQKFEFDEGTSETIAARVPLEELVEKLTESSLPTHASPQCLSSCAYFGLVLCALLHGLDRTEVLDPDWAPLEFLKNAFPLHPEVAEVATGSFRSKSPRDIVGSGYVVQSLEAALWAFHDGKDFGEAVLRGVNLGDDADTTGAVCGQLAGAFWGESGIPTKWLEELARPDLIDKALAELLGPAGPPLSTGL